MEQIIMFFLFGLFIIFAFIYGLNCGQKIAKNKSIVIPSVNTKVKEFKLKKEEKKINTKIDTELENIDNYDGTGLGQKDIPR